MALPEITAENFNAEVLESPMPVLLDFWGPQCAPCIALDPVMERLAEEYRDRVKIAKVVVSENRRLCLRLRIMGLPVMVGYREGEETARVGGDDLSEFQIRSLIESLAGASGRPPE